LPGYNGQLPSTHYSGYIPVGKLSGSNGNLHYWLIEAEKEAATAPVVLWLNGGPGSSSLIGLLTENGQIMTNDDSLTQKINGVPQVFYNKYSWSGRANMLYLESPKGVGFSYCDDAKSANDCQNTDESTAQDAYEFLVNFFAAYPEYKKNEFYITGESYAGIYIPMMLDQIDQDPLGAKINFIGAAIGNGCWGNTVGTCDFSSADAARYKADFFFGHGFYSQALREEMEDTCGDFKHLSPKCLGSISEMMTQIGSYNVYNIYDTCGNDQRRRLEESKPKSYSQVASEMSAKTVTVETAQSFKVSAGYGAALNDYECGGETAMDEWLADPSVIEALHVKAGTAGMQYTKTVESLLPLYKDLVARHPDNIVIYSGDTDGCVPYVGTEEWTRNLGYNVTKDWHQWFAKPDDVHGLHKAGYAVQFDKFQFVTINGAGHMVPQYQPGFSLELFNKFLDHEKF
jgi:carboxypeptidase C (cathepsin A)